MLSIQLVDSSCQGLSFPGVKAAIAEYPGWYCTRQANKHPFEYVSVLFGSPREP